MTDNKRDLFTDGFTESDFEFGTHSGQMLVAKIMMDKANAILREALEQALVLIDTLTAPLHRYDAGASDNQLNWIVNGQKNRILEYRKRNNQKIDE